MIRHPYLESGTNPPPILVRTEIWSISLMARGKVRDIYDLGDHLLIVATDRISAFDVVMEDPIPGKGLVLTALSEFWFERTADLVRNHLLSTSPSDVLPYGPWLPELAGRLMLVRKAKRVDVECVVRGFLAGSGWEEYRTTGCVAGTPLPTGLIESQQLPNPIFTPATKAATGHDVNISVAQMESLVGGELTRRLAEASLKLYESARDYAAGRGIIIADTKFEFGLLDDGDIILIDEALTPDSSRFWPAAGYEPGGPQLSFDKQYLRDYLISCGWDREPPPPPLPPEVVRRTSEKYLEAYRRLVGEQ